MKENLNERSVELFEQKVDISCVSLLGDSLTDTGTLNRQHLLGIPMRYFSPLEYAPEGRFTNGKTWADLFSAFLIDEFIIKQFIKKNSSNNLTTTEGKKEVDLTQSDIAEGIIVKDPNIDPIIHKAYSLNDDLEVKFHGKDIIRKYCEGGLTAHDYSWQPTFNIKLEFKRLVLATLKQKREQLLAYDSKNSVPPEDKKKTLIVEWSGANDFITVNNEPSTAIADIVLEERIKNVEELIKNGYRHFVLFNLPDFSLTPRYQLETPEARKNAHDCAGDFNQKLQDAIKDLRKKYSAADFSFGLFNIFKNFNEMYQNPAKYGLDEKKLTQPYITSKEFKINQNHTSCAKGYMFWDKVHPTAEVHARLAAKFCEVFGKKFNFIAPQYKELTIDDFSPLSLTS